MHLGAVDPDGPPGQVDLEPLDAEERLLGPGGGATEVRLETRDQLPGTERLGHVVVRAGRESADLGVLVADGREDDQRHLAPFAQATAQLDSVHVGQDEIDDPGVRRMERGEVEGFLAGRGRQRLEAGLAQDHTQRPEDLRFVVND